VKPSKIAVTYERKLNLGNYESATIGVTTWADVEDGETPSHAIQAAQELCRESARRETTRLLDALSRNGRQPIATNVKTNP